MLGKVEICGVNTSRLQTLSNEEMMRLIELAQKGDQAAKQRLVEGNLKLVLSVIQRFLGRGRQCRRDGAARTGTSEPCAPRASSSAPA